MRKLRVLVLMREDLVPPDTIEGLSPEKVAPLKTEYDVVSTLRAAGHEARPLGVATDLGVIRDAIVDWKPDIAFNLLEEFHGVVVYDAHVASFLELMKKPYTGCNPRGLMLARDKALAKKILHYHRILVPQFLVFPRYHKVRPPKRLKYPVMVKSLVDEASLGISQASVVTNEDKLRDRVAYLHDQILTDALVEEYIDGRELYVGVMGNRRIETLPVWELLFTKMPDDALKIATAKVKWDPKYQERRGIKSQEAKDLPNGHAARISKLCRRVYRLLSLSGYARIDLRMNEAGELYVLEANPNPQVAQDEDFADAAHAAGIPYDELLEKILNLGLRYRAEWKEYY